MYIYIPTLPTPLGIERINSAREKPPSLYFTTRRISTPVTIIIYYSYVDLYEYIYILAVLLDFTWIKNNYLSIHFFVLLKFKITIHDIRTQHLIAMINFMIFNFWIYFWCKHCKCEKQETELINADINLIFLLSIFVSHN